VATLEAKAQGKDADAVSAKSALAFSRWLANSTDAQPSAHYVPGSEGIKGASLPPPGFWLRDYNYFYFSDSRNDPSGNKIDGLDANAFIYANIPRLLWITETKVLGGYLGMDALIPLAYTDLNIKAGPNTLINNNTFGVGDLFAEGTWSSHVMQFDFALGAGVWAPTGNSSDQSIQTPTTMAGLGYWTYMLTAGATWYIDDEKKWSVSALNRYEFSTEKEDTETIPGQAYKLMVDVGSLFYEQRIRPKPMDIRISGPAGETRIEAYVPSMVILGISGARTYGGHMPVLPGRENACVVGAMSVLSKIRNKKLFYLGRHGELSEVSFFQADQVDISYAGRIPMQLDGEISCLQPSDFPLSMNVLEPRIKVLRV